MTGFLHDLWYVACLARDVRPGALKRQELLGEPVLLGRTKAGAAFALRDVCPHRAAPLSAGRIVENGAGASVECPYHGWRFKTADGACAEIPSLVEGQDFPLEKVKVRRYPLVERDGLLWVFMPAHKHFQGEPGDGPPPLPGGLDGVPKLVEKRFFDCHVDHAVVGLMDPAHGPYVHRQWWWRSHGSMHEKAKRFGPVERGFSMLEHRPSSNSYAYRILGGAPSTEIVFRLPGVRTELIRNDRHVILAFTAVTPVNAAKTEIIQVFYWNWGLLSLLRPIVRPFARAFLEQDGSMVDLQQQGLKYDPALMLIDDADTQAKWYHRLKKEWSASREEGRPFVNPIEPVTLRWRS